MEHLVRYCYRRWNSLRIFAKPLFSYPIKRPIFQLQDMNSLPSHIIAESESDEVDAELRLALRQIKQSSCEPKTTLAI